MSCPTCTWGQRHGDPDYICAAHRLFKSEADRAAEAAAIHAANRLAMAESGALKRSQS